MLKDDRLLCAAILLLSIGSMAALWIFWEPEHTPMQITWWVLEIFFLITALMALRWLILTGFKE
jgi:hypothetical protein